MTEEIDSSLSPVINVLNHQGHELASESRAGLDFAPSADGEYYIQLLTSSMAALTCITFSLRSPKDLH